MNSEPLLTPAERRRMLEEIGRVAIAVGREMAGDPLDAETSLTPGALTGRECLALLESELPALQRALAQIAVRPRTALVREAVTVPADRARNPTAQAIQRAFQSASTLPHRIEDSRPFVIADTPENRWVAALLSTWRSDLHWIAALAEWEGDSAGATRAREIAAALSRAAAAAYLAECAPTGSTVTDALLRDIRYRRLCETDRRYRRLLQYAWDAPALSLPPREPWQLYEIWCCFRVAAALRSLGLRAREGDAVVLLHDRWTIALAKGHPSRLRFEGSGRSASLYYNREFPSAAVGSREPSSRTHTMIPDICLERAGRFLILDPKFRRYAEPGEEQIDIVKMHAYRDAIVAGERPAVDGAWCLFPGRAEGGAPILAYPAGEPERPYGRAHIGAIRLRPGQGEAPLTNLIAEWLAA